MQKRSHKLLASTLLEGCQGFDARRFELAFLFGSFQPDCNPFTYLRGSLKSRKLGGHNYISSRNYIHKQIKTLQKRTRWTIWQYYALGKLTHYLADAFTYPHNETFADTLMGHRHYETSLRLQLAETLPHRTLRHRTLQQDLTAAIEELHRQYLSAQTDLQRDIRFILRSAELLMSGCLPSTASFGQSS